MAMDFCLVAISCLFLFSCCSFAFTEVCSSFIQTKLSFLFLEHIQEESFLLTQNISKCHIYCSFLAYLCDTMRMRSLFKFTVYYVEKKIRWRKYFLCPIPLNILKQMASFLLVRTLENMSASFSKSPSRCGSALLI